MGDGFIVDTVKVMMTRVGGEVQVPKMWGFVFNQNGCALGLMRKKSSTDTLARVSIIGLGVI